MAFSIKDEETDKLTRQLAELANEGITQAVKQSVLERLERLANTSEEARVQRKKRIEAFLASQKPVKLKGKFDLKKIRDELWEQ